MTRLVSLFNTTWHSVYIKTIDKLINPIVVKTKANSNYPFYLTFTNELYSDMLYESIYLKGVYNKKGET